MTTEIHQDLPVPDNKSEIEFMNTFALCTMRTLKLNLCQSKIHIWCQPTDQQHAILEVRCEQSESRNRVSLYLFVKSASACEFWGLVLTKECILNHFTSMRLTAEDEDEVVETFAEIFAAGFIDRQGIAVSRDQEQSVLVTIKYNSKLVRDKEGSFMLRLKQDKVDEGVWNMMLRVGNNSEMSDSAGPLPEAPKPLPAHQIEESKKSSSASSNPSPKKKKRAGNSLFI